MSISAQDVQKLREMTDIGMMKCKKALTEAGGDFDKAVELLRKQGLESAKKKSDRETAEGLVGSYIHHNGKLGVLVEVRCESDFVARGEAFQEFVHDLCLQIAQTDPLAVRREDLPEDVVAKEREIEESRAREEHAGKPDNVIQKIIDGRMRKFYEERCLLEQKFIKDDSQTIEELLKGMIAKLGENMVIASFSRIKLGDA